MDSFLISTTDISHWLDMQGICDYRILDDKSVAVRGSVNLAMSQITRLPVQFKEVEGNFVCAHNLLTSLLGSPRVVGGNFDCAHNLLSNMHHAPKQVGGYFSCAHNMITSLELSPERVHKHFNCVSNSIANLDHIPDFVGDDFHCAQNPQLGRLQYVSDFKEIKNFVEHLHIQKEKRFLCENFAQQFNEPNPACDRIKSPCLLRI